MGYFLVILAAFAILLAVLLLLLRCKPHAVVVSLGSLMLSAAVLWAGMFAEVADVEFLNGEVLSKQRVEVSCEHSYQCSCIQSCSTSNGTTSCSTSCSTCYEHLNDYDWEVVSNVGHFDIARIDRRGEKMPARWAAVRIGEPVALPHTFVNYIKGSRQNVLNRGAESITYPMPTYPTPYDYYRADRFVTVGVFRKDAAQWNLEISNALKKLGPSRQVNLVIVLTKYPEEYADQLNAAWLGGKKNDVIVVIGDNTGVASWVKVLSWTKREDFKIQLRDRLIGSSLEPAATVNTIAESINSNFVRASSAEFEYLRYDIKPSDIYLWVSFILFFVPPVGYWLVINQHLFQFRRWRY